MHNYHKNVLLNERSFNFIAFLVLHLLINEKGQLILVHPFSGTCSRWVFQDCTKQTCSANVLPNIFKDIFDTSFSGKSAPVSFEQIFSFCRPELIRQLIFQVDHEFVCKGYILRKGRIKVTVFKLFKVRERKLPFK